MSWGANEWARKTRVGDSKLKLLLIILSNYANEAGECWHSQERISHDTEIPVRTLRRKLDELAERGLIEIVPRTREDGTKASNLIRLLASPPANVADGEASGQNSQRPKTGGTTGQNAGPPPATWMAEQESPRSKRISNESIRAREAGEFFDARFWPAFPKRDGSNPKEPARKKFIAAVVGGENPEEILAGAIRLEQDLRRQGRLLSQFVPQCVTWLNQRRWRDDPPPEGSPPPGNGPNDRGGQSSFFGAANEIGNRNR